MAASILRNKKVHRELRVIVIPGTQEIYLEALPGPDRVFVEAGAVVSTHLWPLPGWAYGNSGPGERPGHHQS